MSVKPIVKAHTDGGAGFDNDTKDLLAAIYRSGKITGRQLLFALRGCQIHKNNLPSLCNLHFKWDVIRPLWITTPTTINPFSIALSILSHDYNNRRIQIELSGLG